MEKEMEKTERKDCGCDMDKSACDRNPKHEKFDKVVATWQTVRHYDISSYDTLESCDSKCYRQDNLEKCACHMDGCRKCDNDRF